MARLFTLFFLSMGIWSIQTQNQQKAPCNTDKHNEFNFWVGNWNVYNPKGDLIGTNKILKMHSNCVMQENWESKTGPNKGTSYNYVNLIDNTWNQVWIDNNGYSLVLKGNPHKGSMILQSEVQKGQNGDFYNRVTWIPNEDGTITQLWEILSTEDKVIQEAFRGIYKKNKQN